MGSWTGEDPNEGHRGYRVCRSEELAERQAAGEPSLGLIPGNLGLGVIPDNFEGGEAEEEPSGRRLEGGAETALGTSGGRPGGRAEKELGTSVGRPGE